MRRVIQAVLVAGCIAVPAASTAQTHVATGLAPEPRRGSIVRVVQRDADRPTVLRGRLSRVAGDTVDLVVDDGYSNRVTTIVLDQRRVLEVRTGHKSQWAKGLGIGFLTGSVAGGLMGAAAYKPCEPQGGTWDCFLDFGQAYSIGVGASAGALLGSVLGLAIGAASGKETWSAVGRTSPARITIAPSLTGLAAGVRLEF